MVNLSDQFGRVPARIDYDDWGRVTAYQSITVTGGFRVLLPEITYAGHQYDDILDLFYAKARMYDADTRRFQAMDPVKGNIVDPLSLVYEDGSVVYWNDALGSPHQYGDGAKYRGAGYLHLTWKMTYYDFSQYVGDDRIMEGVDYVAENYAWESAGWFWREYKGITVGKDTTVTQVTSKVNGGDQGLNNRKLAYEVFKKILVG